MTFEGFESTVVDVGATTIALQRGGTGHPVLLLHGFPETHVMWHRVAPALAENFTVVCADLRGYGASGTPPSTSDHAPYAKAAMAGDMVTVMDHLGFRRFSVVGHDRGGRVAYRLALDHEIHVEKLVVLDRAAGRQIHAPTLVLWATSGPLDAWYEVDGGPLGIWRAWATQVEGEPLPGGHFFPEENPDDTLAVLRAFLRR